MKYLVLCEGTNEKTIINLLLDANKLRIKRDDLVGLTPYNVRQLSNPTIKSQLKIYNQPVIILRIGDTQREKFPIPTDLKNIVSKDRIIKYCTLPELEILLIINEGMYKQFLKSGEKKPKTFAKRNIVYNKKRYDQSNEFFEMYYGGKRISNLIDNLNKYKTYCTFTAGFFFIFVYFLKIGIDIWRILSYNYTINKNIMRG